MPRKPKKGRPKPFAVGDIRARVIRGPKAALWYWRAERHFDRRTVWTGWASRADAIDEVSRLVAAGLPERHDAGPGNQVRTVTDLMRAWIGYREDNDPDLRASSIRAYKLSARHLRDVIGDVTVDRLTADVLARANTDLHRRLDLSGRTRLTDLERLRAAWDWARPRGHVPNRDFPPFKVTVSPKAKHTPSQTEVRRMLGEVRIPWRRAAIRLMHATGARVGDVANLVRADLDPQGQRIRFVGKTDERWVRIPPDLAQELEALLETHDRPELLGVTPTTCKVNAPRGMKRACAALGIQPFSPHAVRRSFVDHMQSEGVDVATTCSFTGHTPQVMFQYYRQATEQDQMAAIRKARVGWLPDEDNVIPLRPGLQSGGPTDER